MYFNNRHIFLSSIFNYGIIFLINLKKPIIMKLFKNIAIVAAVGLFAVGCNNQKENEEVIVNKDTTVITNDAPMAMEVTDFDRTEGKSTPVMEADVPAPVKTTFTTKYPKVTTVEWLSYEPTDWDEWTVDKKYYFVKYNDRGTEYYNWYDSDGKWVKSSTKVTGDPNLPDAVNKTINEKFPGYTIAEIDKENDNDRDMYEVELHNGDKKAKLKILMNGEIFKQKIKD